MNLYLIYGLYRYTCHILYVYNKLTCRPSGGGRKSSSWSRWKTQSTASLRALRRPCARFSSCRHIRSSVKLENRDQVLPRALEDSALEAEHRHFKGQKPSKSYEKLGISIDFNGFQVSLGSENAPKLPFRADVS